MVNVAVSVVAAILFASTYTIPEPLPLAPLAIVAQGWLLEAVQEHPLGAVTT
jgi:hypothetical protein